MAKQRMTANEAVLRASNVVTYTIPRSDEEGEGLESLRYQGSRRAAACANGQGARELLYWAR